MKKSGKVVIQAVRVQGRAWGSFRGSNTLDTQMGEVVKELAVLDVHQQIEVVEEICTKIGFLTSAVMNTQYVECAPEP